jgi:hypothetical protein
MPQPSTLKYVADLVLERVFAEIKPGEDLAVALKKAYPFGNSEVGRQIWLDALLRHAAGLRIDFANYASGWHDDCPDELYDAPISISVPLE